MSTESSEPTPGANSRRSFLLKLGLGMAGLAGISTGLVRLGGHRSNGSNTMDDEFPGPDSIFHPAWDPRTDPRRG